MKKLLFIFSLCMAGLTSPSFASMGAGCNVWGPVSYVYFANISGTSSLVALINGYICIVNGSTTSLTPLAGILVAAQVHGKQAFLTDNNAAINP